MEAYLLIFLDAVVVGRWFPSVGEEDHANCLTEIVELEACGTDGGYDRGIVDCLHWNVELTGAEDKIGVRCSPVEFQCCGLAPLSMRQTHKDLQQPRRLHRICLLLREFHRLTFQPYHGLRR